MRPIGQRVLLLGGTRQINETALVQGWSKVLELAQVRALAAAVRATTDRLDVLVSIDSIEEGVAATYWLVTDPALATTTGRFFDRTREAKAHPQAYDTHARAELWQRSLKLLDHPDMT